MQYLNSELRKAIPEIAYIVRESFVIADINDPYVALTRLRELVGYDQPVIQPKE